ncbi:MAG TPA: hypothetical protein VOA87_00015 [Thermoanaerobaculia bacterium]|nr:hypothetical protein [Thermoanaerobaculia bacterium]
MQELHVNARAVRLTAALLLTTGILLAWASPAGAMPLWARRYGITCSTCHAFPSLQLTATGLDFLRRGHRFTGDTFDKDITHLLSGHGEWSYDHRQGVPTPFENPEFHLHAGGALSPLFSAYVDANVNNDFESAYLQYTKAHDDSSYFTARLGKLSPTIVRNYGNGLLASSSTPLIVTDAVLGNNPFTPARGSAGVDVGGRWHSFFLQGGVVNGESQAGVAEVNNHKDVYATAEYALPDGVSGLGLYYHRGTYDLLVEDGEPLRPDTYDRSGLFANFTRDKVRVAGAYLTGTDRIAGLEDAKLRGFFVEADLHAAEDWVPFARYDETRLANEARTRKATVGCAVRIFETEATAGRLVLELSRQEQAADKTNGALLNVIWAF